MHTRHQTWAVLAAGGVMAAAAHAVPPNDDCGSAIPLANHSTTVWNPIGATADGALPSCASSGTAINVWYSYTATGAELVTVGTCGGANLGIAVFGSCGGAQTACRANSCISRIVFETTGPGTYLICAFGYPGQEQASALQLDAYPVAAPGSDSCAGATPVVDGDNPVSTIGATLDESMTGPLSCYRGATAAVSASPDVWYSYTAPETGLRTFELTVFALTTDGSTSGSDTKLGIFSACGGSVLACDDDGGWGTLSKLYRVPVTENTTYLIRVANSRFAPRDKGVLRITAPGAGSNVPGDECANAIPVAGQPMTIPFNTGGMSRSDARQFDVDMLADGWLAWTPSVSGVGLATTCGLTTDATVLSIYDSCDDAPVTTSQSFRMGATAACGVQSRLCVPVEAGHTYWVRYAGANNTDPVAAAVGSILLDVVPHSQEYAPPSGAIAEPGACADPFTSDVNGGCGLYPDVVPNTFTPIQLCVTYQGIASARLEPLVGGTGRLTGDVDYYQFTLDTDQAVTITGQSEFLPRGTTGIKFNCPATTVASLPSVQPDCLKDAYSLNMTTGLLVAGTYSFMIAPAEANAGSTGNCAGKSRYWFRITGSEPCAPATVNCCRGTTCQADVAAAECAGIVAGSNATAVAACTGNTFAGCCFGDYDHNGTKDITDIFTFLNAWFGSSVYADITDNGASAPDITDIFTFLNAWFGTCE